MTETKMRLQMEAIPVRSPVRERAGHPSDRPAIRDPGRNWLKKAGNAAHQTMPPESYVYCESGKRPKHPLVETNTLHNLSVCVTQWEGRNRRIPETVERAVQKIIPPSAHVDMDDSAWSTRLPWPAAVLFIFVTGIALWWAVFRLASALLA